VADMQGDARDLDSTLCQRGDKRGSEVQPGGRGRDRPARVGEDGLIAIAIRRSVVALDVRGQRHVPDGVDRLVQGRSVVGPQPDDPSSEEALLEDLTLNGVNSLKHYA